MLDTPTRDVTSSKGTDLGILAVLTMVYLTTGEGPSARPMAPRRIGVAEFVTQALSEWVYGVVFAASGLIFVLLLTTHVVAISDWKGIGSTAQPWEVALIAGAAGFTLGLAVPALYELFYLREGEAVRRPVESTLLASVIIGCVAAVRSGLVLLLFVAPGVAALALPVLLITIVADTLGAPCVAVLIWSLQHRAPLRINRFWDLSEALGLVRVVGAYHLIDHAELGRFVGRSAAIELAGHVRREQRSRVARNSTSDIS